MRSNKINNAYLFISAANDNFNKHKKTKQTCPRNNQIFEESSAKD